MFSYEYTIQKNEMEKCMVSVIVPFFNAESDLKKCVDSILNQTYQNIELVMVDDGSTDSSLKICKDYATKDYRVHVYHQKNCGVALARNRGLRESKGEYISFVDADDYIEPDFVEKLYHACRSRHCNLSMCNYDEIKGNKRIPSSVIVKDGVIFSEELIKDIMYGRKLEGFCWGKIWKRELIVQEFRKYRYCEDFLFLVENLSSKNERIATVKKMMYHYVKHDDSITKKKETKDLMHTLDVASRVVRISRNSLVIRTKDAYAMALNFAFFAFLSANDEEHEDKLLKERCKRWIKQLRGYVFLNFESSLKTKGACILSLLPENIIKKAYCVSNKES